MTPFIRLKTVLILAAAAAPALAAPETFNVDSGHTFVRFSYQHLGLSTQLSRFNKVSGTVVFDQEKKTGSVDIAVDTTSVDTGSGLFDKHIQDAEFLDTATYPTATFRSTKVEFKGNQPVAVAGNLTIKGITRPVTLKITHFIATQHPMLKKPAIGADATTVVKRSDFNMGKYAPNVGDAVTITVSLEATRDL